MIANRGIMFNPGRIQLMDAGRTAMLLLALPLAGLIGCDGEVAGPGPTSSLPAAAVTLSAPALTIRSGTSSAVTATLRDSAGNSLSGRTVVWTSSDPLVATVRGEPTQSATLAAVGVGEVTITASVDGVVATLTFGVTPPAGPLGKMRGFLYSASEGFSEILATAGGSDVLPADINDAGQVAGNLKVGQGYRAFLWTRDGGMTDLGVPGGWDGSWATAVNARGIVVGYVFRYQVEEGEAGRRAFRWSSTTGMVILPVTGFPFLSSAHDVNTQGDIVGATTDDRGRPIRWTLSGTVEDIGTARGGSASAINDKGQVAGSQSSSNQGSIATLWDGNATVIDIGSCGTGCFATANAINELGQVAGTIGNNAFYWSRAEGVTTMGSGAGSIRSTADGINSSGEVIVNRHYDNNIQPRAFLWTRSTGMRDIGVLAGTISSRAAAINNKGQIVGYSQ